ncbi:YaiI/YqxD family protein [Facklamia sp. 7083-14-GEN3]|uniref:YaiI/YqxD family protein n=1 Tax=Facklamia sp. 7083-14-GEN3 TaxID=2973478 RepID=UPI00215D211A|nr:YaiI/YqxD family protein [Facklamia sp. 7083-14-GEN3]MCR8968606.1 YaiI/YqxD family protein [Facklamia sp. 7083-14-GEN3]
MRILIDADACPVKDEAIKIASFYKMKAIIISTIDHFSSKTYNSDLVETIYIEPGADAVDYHILSIAKKGDIIITQDYGLASLLFSKYRVIHHSGMLYTEYNIEQLLFERHLGQKMRKAGLRTVGPNKFSQTDRKKFMYNLEKLIEDGEQ